MKKCFVMVLLCCLLVAGTAFAKTGTLLVAFGTSMDSARPAIDDIEKAYKKAAGNEPVLLAFTSDIIRNKLAKEGKPVLSVNAAINELAAQGVTDLKIQSLHIAPAEEYNQLERMVVKNITKIPAYSRRSRSAILSSSLKRISTPSSRWCSLPCPRIASPATPWCSWATATTAAPAT